MQESLRLLRTGPFFFHFLSKLKMRCVHAVDPSFLAMLFEYRAIIYDIAARNADGQTQIVCWVDLILAKLSQAVIAAAGSLCGVVHSHRDQPSTILAQRNDDMLRAAAQLPGGHDKGPPEISSYVFTALQDLGATSQGSYALSTIRQPRFVLRPVLSSGSS